MASSRRAAFTIVELLVVIAILGALMAILIPLLGEHHGVARRTDCANRERQVVQAAQLYQADFGSFPGYWMRTSPTNPSGTTWPLALSKYLGRQDVWNVWVKASANQNAPTRKSVRTTLLGSDGLPKRSAEDQLRAMVVLWGQLWFVPQQFEFSRRCLLRPTLEAARPDDFDRLYSNHQGRFVHAILCGEHAWHRLVEFHRLGQATPAGALQYTGFCWQAVTTPNVAQQVNGDKANPNPPMSGTVLGDYARPSSNHPGGVNVTFCDTHYHFLREDVSYYVYQTLMCSDPAKADFPAGAIPDGYVLNDGDY